MGAMDGEPMRPGGAKKGQGKPVAEIVLVHGIAQQQKSAAVLENQWTPCLAAGVRTAGFPEVADRIWPADYPEAIETRMAFYGSLFVAPGQQGDDPGDFTAEESAFAEALALAWLRHAAERATKADVRQTARRELAYVTHQMGKEQGAGRVLRSAIGSLARIPWFAPYGMGLAERFTKLSLTQVTRYLIDDGIRSAALETVSKLIGPETKVLIGHSLGSVVAYEAAHDLREPLPLLVTLGSPLGLPPIHQQLRPEPSFPPNVRRWVNVADPDDFVAAGSDIRGLFCGNKLDEDRFKHSSTVANGAAPHSCDFYLGTAEVGGPVGETFTNAAMVEFNANSIRQ